MNSKIISAIFLAIIIIFFTNVGCSDYKYRNKYRPVQRAELIEGTVHIIEGIPKIMTKVTIEFVTIKDTMEVQRVSYRIYSNTDEITDIQRRVYNVENCIDADTNGVMRNSTLYILNSKNRSFANSKRYPDYFYKMLHKDFLTMNNRQRLKVIDNLYYKINNDKAANTINK